MPKTIISIIIPTYNVEKYINRCLDSIVSQTYGIDNFEIIILDDFSSDHTLDYLKTFESKYPNNTILIPLNKNQGQSHARNIGLSYASGKYITFIDSDDHIDSTMIEKMVSVAEKYDSEIVECGYTPFSSDNNISNINDLPESFHLNLNNNFDANINLLNTGRIAVWGKLYKKSFLNNNTLLFPEGVIYEDVPFSGLCMLLVKKYYRINETLYHYFYNPEGSSFSKYTPERTHQETIVMNHFLTELKQRGLLEVILLKYREQLKTYITVKTFIDPLSLILTGDVDFEVKVSEINYFKDYLLTLFPDAGNNPLIPQNQEIFRLAMLFLNNETSIIKNILSNI